MFARRLLLIATVFAPVVTSVPNSAPAQVECTGDCDGDGTVSVDQLILGVNIALGQMRLDECEVFDANANGRLAIDELSAGVRNAIDGCQGLPATLTLFPVGDRTVALGSTLTLRLSAFDPGRRPLSFSAAPVPLPANASLDGASGQFTFAPGIDQVGTLSLTFSVSAGDASASETITITVTGALPGGETALTGRILDTNDFVQNVTTPIVGATVSIRGTAITSVSDANGRFTLRGMRAGPTVFDIDTSTANDAPDGSPYAGFHQGLDLIEGVVNVVERPFFLPRIALESITVVDPAATTTVSNPTLGVTLTIPPGTAMASDGLPFDGALSISDVPRALAPEALPDGVDPGMLITIQPLGVTFDTPVPISFPNIDGLPPGTEVDLWSLNPETGQFLIVGTGRVRFDGAQIDTISGGVRAADWHFFLPLVDIAEAIVNLFSPPGMSCESGSETAVSSGELTEQHTLAIYRSFDTPRSRSLLYGSLRADPQPIVSSTTTLPVRAALPRRISARLKVGGIDQGREVFTGTTGLNEDADERIRQSVQFDAGELPTGMYPYQLTLTSHYPMSSVATFVKDDLVVQNESASPFGAGWTLAELQRLYARGDDEFLLVGGDGTTTRFQSPLGKWRKRPALPEHLPLPGTRAALAALALADGIHVVGGSNDIGSHNGQQYVAHDVYDPRTNSWSSLSPLPDAATWGSALVQVGEKLYLIGGAYGGRLVREYDLATDTWRGLGSIPGDGYGGAHAAAAVDGKIYVFSPTGLGYPARVYDPATDTWAGPLAEIPVVRGALAAAVVGNEIYVVGSGNELQIYNPASDSWRQGASLPMFTTAPSVALFDGKLYVAGGSSRADAYGASIDALQIYDIANDSWTTGPSLPSPREFSAAAVAAGKLYVFGGFDPGGFPVANNEELTLALGSPPEFPGPPGDFSRLALNDDGTFTRILPNGTRVNFDSGGLETSVVDRNGNATRYEYGANDRLVRIIDPVGLATEFHYSGDRIADIVDPAARRTLFEHDAAGNLVRIVDPDGTSRRFAYDSRHRLISQTSKRSFTTSYVYDSAGRNVLVMRPDGSTRQFEPSDTVGLADATTGLGTDSNPLPPVRPAQLESVYTDGNDNQTRFTTDAFGNDTVTVDALGQMTRTTRTAEGLSSELTRADGARTAFVYDGRGNGVLVRQAVGLPEERVLTTVYDNPFSQPTSVTDFAGHRSTFEYDAAGNVTRIVNEVGAETVFEYGDPNCVGLVTRSTKAPGRPEASTTLFEHDPSTCNLSKLTEPGSGVTLFQYDGAGNVNQVTDGNGRVTRFRRDALNRITRTIDATNAASDPPCGSAGVSCQTYDADGNLATSTDARGGVTSYEYDELGRLVRETDPAAHVDTIAYDGNGNATMATDANGQTSRFEYDALDRRVSDNLSEEPGAVSTAASFDSVGNVTSLTDAAAALGSTYNRVDDVTAATMTAATGPPRSRTDYTRTKSGLPATLSVTTESNPVETVGYDYDDLNRLLTITAEGGKRLAYRYGYDTTGQLTVRGPTSDGAGVATTFSFDAGVRLTRMTNTSPDGNTVFTDVAYGYDAVGNVTSATDGQGPTNYTYDPLYRLSSANGPGISETYSYDGVGNRLTKDGLEYTYDVASRLVSSSDGTTYTYDANGNLRTKAAGGATTTYTWNERNQLVRIDFPDATIAEYTYDAVGRRLSKRARDGTERHYVYDGVHLVQELDATGAVRASYVYDAIDHALSMTRDGTTYFYVYDRLGSVVGLTDGAGTLVVRYHYDPWGNLLASEGSNPGIDNPLRFTGREWDAESGLYYYRLRYYDPAVGRFISRDPLGTGYVYVSNNPVNAVDPLGLIEWRTLAGGVAGIVVGAIVVATLPATLTAAAAGTAAAGLVGAVTTVVGSTTGAVAVITAGTAIAAGGAAGAVTGGIITGGGVQGAKEGFKGGLVGGAIAGIVGQVFFLPEIQLGWNALRQSGFGGGLANAGKAASSGLDKLKALKGFLSDPINALVFVGLPGFFGGTLAVLELNERAKCRIRVQKY